MGNSQNNFSVKPRVAHIARQVAALLSLVLAALIQQSLALPQADEMAMRLRENVVMIFAGPTATSRTGFGFIAGERHEMLYVVTAWHVVYGDKSNPDESPKVKVTFYSDQGAKHDAEILGKNDDRHDLAVLRVSAPRGFQWIKGCLAGPDKEKRGTSVWFVGRNKEWFVPVRPGVVASEVPSTASKIELDETEIRPGSSGGPLVADTGIVGMIQNDAPDYALALTIGFIKNALQEWNYPWDLTNGAPPYVAPTNSYKVNAGSTPVTASTPVAASTGTIQVLYNPEGYGCVLRLFIQVGRKRFMPTSNLYTVGALLLGNTRYVITGTIACPRGTPPQGVCSAAGTGPIDVENNGRYYISWWPYAYAKCAVTLTKY